MKLKYLITLLVLSSIAAIMYGFYIKEDQLHLANKYIGFGTVGIFLVAMPLFLFKESKGKKLQDYMLTEENIRKMQDKKSENKDNP